MYFKQAKLARLCTERFQNNSMLFRTKDRRQSSQKRIPKEDEAAYSKMKQDLVDPLQLAKSATPRLWRAKLERVTDRIDEGMMQRRIKYHSKSYSVDVAMLWTTGGRSLMSVGGNGSIAETSRSPFGVRTPRLAPRLKSQPFAFVVTPAAFNGLSAQNGCLLFVVRLRVIPFDSLPVIIDMTLFCKW